MDAGICVNLFQDKTCCAGSEELYIITQTFIEFNYYFFCYELEIH